jgi:DNA-binding beta-propeller fold protein YncE
MLKMFKIRSNELAIKLGLGCSVLALGLSAQSAPLTAATPIPLPGTHGGFDFIRIDTSANRLLLGHEANKSLDVFDIGSKKLLKSVPTGTAQDAAVDVKRGNYYVSGNDPGRMVIVSAKDLTVDGEVPLPAATDLIAFNPISGLVYECNDSAGEDWLIDPVAKKVVATIKFDGRGVEDLAFDPEHKHLFQAVKGANTVAVVDPADNKVLNAWPLAPDTAPHGIAIVPDSNGLLAACSGKLVLMDRTSGKILDRADTGGRVDELAYDPDLHTAYCASRQGKISVVAVAADKLTALGDVPDEDGTGSIVVDPKTHIVWIAYNKGDECFVQPFTPTH